MNREGTFETTLGDLIVALTDETIQVVHDEKRTCNLVAFMLAHLLNNSSATSRAWQHWQ